MLPPHLAICSSQQQKNRLLAQSFLDKDFNSVYLLYVSIFAERGLYLEPAEDRKVYRSGLGYNANFAPTRARATLGRGFGCGLYLKPARIGVGLYLEPARIGYGLY